MPTPTHAGADSEGSINRIRAAYVAHGDAVYGFTTMLVGPEAAEHVTCRVFLERPPESSGASLPTRVALLGAAYQAASQAGARQEVAPKTGPAVSRPVAIESAPCARVRAALRELAPGERAAVAAMSFCDDRFAAAQILGVQAAVVSADLRRGLARLRSLLADRPTIAASAR